MNKNEAIRQTHQANVLMQLGFTEQEAESLRRISMTLRRWHELECGDGNGCIERDETTGKTFYLNANSGRRYPVADRETGALKRLAEIIANQNGRGMETGPHTITRNPQVSAYVQGDPRGAALYILRPGDVPAGESADAYYSRGICVY